MIGDGRAVKAIQIEKTMGGRIEDGVLLCSRRIGDPQGIADHSPKGASVGFKSRKRVVFPQPDCPQISTNSP